MTVPEIIEIAKASQFLAANDIARRGVYAGGIDMGLDRKLYLIRRSVERVYDLDPSDSTLIKTSNYLYALCGKYGLQARYMTGGGGSVSPVGPPPSTLPQPYEFEVSGSTLVVAGTGSAMIEDFIGYNVIFVRNNLTQSTINQGSSYFSWNRVTGLFQCFPDAVATELFQIYPVG